MSVSFDNYAKHVGKRNGYDWFEWKVFAKGDPSVLDTIEYIEYTLHPTFPKPRRIVRDRKSDFALISSGWGEFTVFITIRFKDGGETRTKYYLSLAKQWPNYP